MQHRLQSEYGAETRLQAAPWTFTRWVKPGVELERGKIPPGVRLAYDGLERPVLLFETEWVMNYFMEKNQDVPLDSLPFE